MDEKEILVGQFCSVADTSHERARFYLESADWQLEVALSSFYDNPSAGEIPETGGVRDVDIHPGLDEPEPPNMLSFQQSPSRAQKSRDDKSKTKKSSKFASIRDLEKDDDQSSEEEGQRFYAGGSEHSGELIVGPPRKKNSNEEIAKNLFKQAKEHGAQAIDASGRDSGISGDSKPKYFGGGGYKLGESDETSEFVPGDEEMEEARPVNVILRLWSNGFTVDDGPLRGFNDPENQEFLNSIKKGYVVASLDKMLHDDYLCFVDSDKKQIKEEARKGTKNLKNRQLLCEFGFVLCIAPPSLSREDKDATNKQLREIPRELLRNTHGGEVHVDMEDHRQEEHKAQKKLSKPFSGQGHRLGSPAPDVYSASDEPVSQMSSSVDPTVVVDKSKPTTTLQIRLAGGKKVRQQFNQTHRISDIRSFIASFNPGSASRPFILMTTFPNKELSEEHLSLSEAKLLNAVVVQKMV